MAFTAEQHREHRDKLRGLGICIRCHKNKAEGSVCNECLEATKKRWTMLAKEGRCKSCGKPLDDKSLKRCVNCSALEYHGKFIREMMV